MPTENPARGSEKLLAQLAKKGSAATPADVKAALALPSNTDYKLLRWLIRGIPPVYFEVETTFQVQPKQLGEAVGRFTANEAVRDIHILINGIPFPDIAQISAVMSHSGKV